MLKYVNTITFEEADRLLSYDPVTGFLTRKVDGNYNAKQGDKFGSLMSYGHLIGNLNGQKYLAHRIAFLLYHKRWPVDEIDHIDGNPANNKIENIREVDRKTNHKNMKRNAKNTSGLMGVDWSKAKKKWRARIKVEYIERHLGVFDDFFEACCARKSAENKYGFHANHGRV